MKSCASYGDCCPTFEKCLELYQKRKDDFVELIKGLNLVEKSIGCPRGLEKEYVCSRIDMGLVSLDKTLESSLWVGRKASEVLLHFPYLQKKGKRGLVEESDTAIYDAVIGVNLFKGLNEKCQCKENLCPSESPNCKIDEVAKVLGEESAVPGRAEEKVYHYVKDKFLKEYLDSFV